jgi:hypothetical protein
VEEIYYKFLDLAVNVAEKRKGTVEWMAPVFEEFDRQNKAKRWDKGAMAAAVKKAKEKVGYHSDYNDCFSYLLSKWPLPKKTVEVVSVQTSSEKVGKVGSKWEEMLRQQQKEKELELEKRKEKNLEKVLEVSEKSSELRFGEAFETLNLKRCEDWFLYLQKTRKVAYEGSLGTDGNAFKECMKLARGTINPLLESRKIYDDSQAVESDLKGAMMSQTDDTMINVVLGYYGLTDSTSPVYWFAKGMILAMNPKMVIRCDGSAALAFYLLSTKSGFNASIGLVRQGDPLWSGHWFLVVGVKSDLKEENINSLQSVIDKKELKRSWCFVVDLWGAAFQKVSDTVGYPAFCVAGDWKKKIVWIV